MKKYLTTILITFFTSTTLIYADPMIFEIPKEKEAKEEKVEQEGSSESTIKLKFEYPTEMVFGFVQVCTTNVAPRMGMPPQQAFPAALKMCSCIMDQFRSDFKKADFVRGGKKLAISMAPQYSKVCQSLITAKGM